MKRGKETTPFPLSLRPFGGGEALCRQEPGLGAAAIPWDPRFLPAVGRELWHSCVQVSVSLLSLFCSL